MISNSFENMIRYYHGFGGAVYGDNQQEIDMLWELISQQEGGRVNGISVETWKKVGLYPRVECKSAVQAIEMADIMNKAQQGRWLTAVLGMITFSR